MGNQASRGVPNSYQDAWLTNSHIRILQIEGFVSVTEDPLVCLGHVLNVSLARLSENEVALANLDDLLDFHIDEVIE